MRVIFAHEQQRRARETHEVAGELQYGETTLQSAIVHYCLAAVAVVAAALWLPRLGAELARQTGLGEASVRQPVRRGHDVPAGDRGVAYGRAHGRGRSRDCHVLGSNLFNLLILALDDVFYRRGPLMADAGSSHSVSIVAIVMMNGLFLIGLTYKVMTKRFVVAWDTGAIAAVYAVAVVLSYLMVS
jgi:cation:H+ antiporter